MPVVSGFENIYSYRCDGSDNTGGVVPAELIAMGTVSISKRNEGVTEQETSLFSELSKISEKWLKCVPSENHSMTLLPWNGGTKWYEIIQEDNGKIDFKEVTASEKAADKKYVERKVCNKDSIAIQAYPLNYDKRSENINKAYDIKVEKWEAANEGKIMNSTVATALREEAEREVPAVGIKFVQIFTKVPKKNENGEIVYENEEIVYENGDYIENYQTNLKTTDYSIDTFNDETTWTPSLLDELGFLSALNAVWSL